MPCSFVAYVDEAGDEGFSFSSGSSEWFVLSAVLTLKAEDLETVKLVDRVRHRLKRPDRKPLHFRDLRHEHRLPFIAEVSRAPLRVIALLIHKPSLQAEVLRQPGRLYFHAAQDLIEGVSRLCQDARPRQGDGTAEVVFSNRSGMSYEDLSSFIVQTDRFQGAPIRCDQIHACSAGQKVGLQIADAVASGFFKAVEPSEYGHTEDRYARMLKPVLYRKGETYRGYGLRFWPVEKDRYDWVREICSEEED
jgi:Protein of unknown function (DUF3800)